MSGNQGITTETADPGAAQVFNGSSGNGPLYAGFEHYVDNAGATARYALQTGNTAMLETLMKDSCALLAPAGKAAKPMATYAAGLVMAKTIFDEIRAEVERIPDEGSASGRRVRYLGQLSDMAVDFNGEAWARIRGSQNENAGQHKYTREAFNRISEAHLAGFGSAWGHLVNAIEIKEEALERKRTAAQGMKQPATTL